MVSRAFNSGKPNHCFWQQGNSPSLNSLGCGGKGTRKQNTSKCRHNPVFFLQTPHSLNYAPRTTLRNGITGPKGTGILWSLHLHWIVQIPIKPFSSWPRSPCSDALGLLTYQLHLVTSLKLIDMGILLPTLLILDFRDSWWPFPPVLLNFPLSQIYTLSYKMVKYSFFPCLIFISEFLFIKSLPSLLSKIKSSSSFMVQSKSHLTPLAC